MEPRVPTPETVLAAIGVADATGVTPVGGGVSGAILWRVSRAAPNRDLLLRLIPHSDMPTVEHEATFQRRAHDGALPAPRVAFAGQVAGCPVIAMEWLPGRTMLGVLRSTPVRAEPLGLASGELLRRIHQLSPVGDLAAGWYVDHCLTAIEPWLAGLVTTGDRPPAALHADFHPVNLLVDDEGWLAVLDWTNASVGDPLIDLGRTFACLRLGAALHGDALGRETIDGWWRGLVAGYGATGRTIEELAPFFAFGLVTLVDDRLRTPDEYVPEAAVQELIAQRDTWLSLAQRADG